MERFRTNLEKILSDMPYHRSRHKTDHVKETHNMLNIRIIYRMYDVLVIYSQCLKDILKEVSRDSSKAQPSRYRRNH